tara:strand:+ start:135 stop:257 length:123 start_codon:yes stop_codon:yes gene_type:complete
MSKKLITENMTVDEIRDIIRKEIARIFFDLYRKRTTWEKI